MITMEEIKKIKCGKIKFDVELKNYTSYKLRGRAKVACYPKTIQELVNVLKYVRENKIKHIILGNGSNIVFLNEYYDGVLIKLDELSELKIDDIKVVVGAGYNLTKLAYKVSKIGLTGLEFATGIPGTVGGAVYMNAGAYNSDMGYVVSEVKVLTPNYEIKTIYNKDLDFHYRTSFFQKNKDYICLEATIILKQGRADVIMDIVGERKKRRLMTQPIEYPSAGSVFRNPKDDYAGRLIEALGYKGRAYGKAEVSEKHANFIINRNGASGDEIKKLVDKIKNDVKKEYNIELMVEQEFVE